MSIGLNRVEDLISHNYHGYLPSELQTLPILNPPSPDCDATQIYGDILTERAIERWRDINEQFNRGETKNTFLAWHLQPCKSGSWIRNPKLPTSGITLQGILNTYSNRQVVGRFPNRTYTSEDEFVYSSVILFFGYGWCFTTSGSLYAIPGEHCTAEDPEMQLPWLSKLP